jgi:phosphoribosylformimino-5-aminoimidazole carboxamide ribotide isomerase
MSATIYPAIDVRGGRTVRLRQGDYARETQYADDPADLARRYADAGATWLHLVDLDAARDGGYRLAPLLREIRRTTALRVQTGGGVRCASDVDAILDAGADRVVVGSVAVSDPPRVASWLDDFGPERIVVALDARKDGNGVARVPAHGWTAAEAPPFDGLLDFHCSAGMKHLLCTAIARDGTLEGPDLDFYAAVRAAAPEVALQASGGIRDARDLRAARTIGCAGVVLGRTLLESRLTMQEALAW